MDIAESTTLRQKADRRLHTDLPPAPPPRTVATTPPPSPTTTTTTMAITTTTNVKDDTMTAAMSRPTGIPARPRKSITYEESNELQLKRMGSSFIKQRDSLPGGLPPPNTGVKTNDPYAAYSNGRKGKFYGFPTSRRASRVSLQPGEEGNINNSNYASTSGANAAFGGGGNNNSRRVNPRGPPQASLQDASTDSNTNLDAAQRRAATLNRPTAAPAVTNMGRGGVVSVRPLASAAEGAWGPGEASELSSRQDNARYDMPPAPSWMTREELAQNPARRRLQEILDKVQLADAIVNGALTPHGGADASATHMSRAGGISRIATGLPVRTAEERQRQLLEVEKAKLLLFVGRKFNVEKRIEEVMSFMDISASAGSDSSATANHNKARRQMEQRLQDINRTLFSDPFFTSTRRPGRYTSSVNSQDDFNVAALRRVIGNLESELKKSESKVEPGVEEIAKEQEQQLRHNTFSNFKDMCWLIESLDDVFASDGSKVDLPEVVSTATPGTTVKPTTNATHGTAAAARSVEKKTKAASAGTKRQASPSPVNDSDKEAGSEMADETLGLAPSPFFITETNPSTMARVQSGESRRTTRPSRSGAWTPSEPSVVPFSLLLSEQEAGPSRSVSTSDTATAAAAKVKREDRVADHPQMNLLDFMWDAAPTAEEEAEAAAAEAAQTGNGGSRPFSSTGTRSRPMSKQSVNASRPGTNYAVGGSGGGPHRLGHFAEMADDGFDDDGGDEEEEDENDGENTSKRKHSSKSTASGADGTDGGNARSRPYSGASAADGANMSTKRPRSKIGARGGSAAAKAPPRAAQNVLNLRADLLQDLKKLYNLYNYDKLIEQRRDSANRQREAENAQQIAEMQARLQEKMNLNKDKKKEDTTRKDSFEGLDMLGRTGAPSRTGERPKSSALATKAEEDPTLEAKEEEAAPVAPRVTVAEEHAEKAPPAGTEVTNASIASHSPSPLLEDHTAEQEEAHERRSLISGLAELVDFDIDDEEMALFAQRIPGQRVVLEEKLDGGLTFILSGVLKKKEREREQAEADAAAATASGGKGDPAPAAKPKKGKAAAVKKKAPPLCPFQFYILRVINEDYEDMHIAEVTISNKSLKNIKTFVMPGVQRKSGLCYLYPVQPRHARVFLRLDPIKPNKATSVEGGLFFREAESEDVSDFKTFDVLQQVAGGSDDDSWAVASSSRGSLTSAELKRPAQPDATASEEAVPKVAPEMTGSAAAATTAEEKKNALAATTTIAAAEVSNTSELSAIKPGKEDKGKAAAKAKEKKGTSKGNGGGGKKSAGKAGGKKDPKAPTAEENTKNKLPAIKSPANQELTAPLKDKPSTAVTSQLEPDTAGPCSPSLSAPPGVSPIMPNTDHNGSLPSLPPGTAQAGEEKQAATGQLGADLLLEGTEEGEEGEVPVVTDVLNDTPRPPEEWGQARPDTVEEAMENNLIVLSALQMQEGGQPPEEEDDTDDEDGTAGQREKVGGEEGGEMADAGRPPNPGKDTPAPAALTEEESEAAAAKRRDDDAMQAAVDGVLSHITLSPATAKSPDGTAHGELTSHEGYGDNDDDKDTAEKKKKHPATYEEDAMSDGLHYPPHDAETPEKIAAVLVQGIEEAVNSSSEGELPSTTVGGESALTQKHDSLSMEDNRPTSAALPTPLHTEETAAAAKRLLSVVEEHSMASLSKAQLSYGWLPPPTLVVTSRSSRPLQTVEDVEKYGLVAGIVVDRKDYSYNSVRPGASSASRPSLSRVPADDKRSSSAPFLPHLVTSDSATAAATRKREDSIFSSKNTSVVFDVTEARTDMGAWVNQTVQVPEIIRSRPAPNGNVTVFVPPELQEDPHLLTQGNKSKRPGDGTKAEAARASTGTAGGSKATKLPASVARAEAVMRNVMKKPTSGTNNKGPAGTTGGGGEAATSAGGAGHYSGNPAGRTDMEVLELQARELYMQDPLRYDAVIDDMMKKVAVLLTAQETALKPSSGTRKHNTSSRPSMKVSAVQFGAAMDDGSDAHNQSSHHNTSSRFSSSIPHGGGGGGGGGGASSASSPTRRDTTRRSSAVGHLPPRRTDTFRISRVAMETPKGRGRVEDGENEIQRILYEQMKAKLVLEAVIRKMQALWARKERLTSERDKERARHAYARTMEVTWQFERRRVVNLSKLIHMLDRKVGRQRGTWIPYYSDNNILEEANQLHYRETQRRWYTTAPGRLQGSRRHANKTTTAKGFVPMSTTLVGGPARGPATINLNANLPDSNDNYDYTAPSWQSYHVPPPPALMRTPGQQRIYHAMALARRRKLLPLHLVRWEAQYEWNRHLLFGYKRQIVPGQPQQQQHQAPSQPQPQPQLHKTTMTFAGPEAKSQSGGLNNTKKAKTVTLASPAIGLQRQALHNNNNNNNYNHNKATGGHPAAMDRLPQRRALFQTAPTAAAAAAGGKPTSLAAPPPPLQKDKTV